MKQATKDWQDACPACGIVFEEVPTQDSVTFVVRYSPGMRPVARAFFPYTAPSERILRVFDPFFASNPTFDPVGVLRHELGHVLGYRHEHTRGADGRAINGCSVENDRWVPLTPYDSKSVMHYLCGGLGDRTLAITARDRLGHECVYVHGGPPCPNG
jgi:hypothetical protein